MKQRFMKLISCVLSIVILLPTIVTASSAAGDSTYDLRGTTLMPNIHPDDWIQAFNDGVKWFDWGYFHRAVQEEIRVKYGLGRGELYIPGSGKNGDDNLYGGNGTNIICGDSGNDVIHGGDSSSYLYGGDGEDFVYGGGEADVLDGGKGNDYLQGDHGDDTYIFKNGYGIDTINDSGGSNTIRICGLSTSQMVNTRNAQNDLIIDFAGTTDRFA